MSNSRVRGGKYDYYSGAGITLFFLVCQLLKYKQQLLLNAVGKCLGHKQLILYPGLCVQGPGGVEESTAGETLSAAGHKRNAGTETSVSILQRLHASLWHPKPITYLGSGTSF